MSVALEEYSAVIGQIYDASLDVSAWARTLESTCRFVGASKAALAALAPQERRYQLELHVGYEPGWIELYNRKYAALNPLGGSATSQEVGEILCLSEKGLIGAFDGDPMYEEWVKPQRILDIAEVVLDRSFGHVGTLAYTRVESDGVFTHEMIEKIRLLFPHVRRSVLISRVLKMHRRGEGELVEVIDSLASGVLMLSEAGEVLRRNPAAAEMLAGGRLMVQASGRLKFVPPAADRAFVQALRSGAGGSTALGGKGVSIPLTESGGGKYLAHLLPLKPASAEDELGARGAKFALFVSPAHPDLGGALDTLAETYELTAAEKRLALALVEIGPTPMIAEALGVSVATVRTHLRSLFQKTGARRQAEIVSLVRGFASPFG